jgi:hypothetical protein
MATERNKWIDAVGKLIALTQERKLIWKSGPFEILETEYAGKTLRLFTEDDGYGNRLSKLQLQEPGSGKVWDFPYSEAIEHLMEAATYQVVGVGDFLDELLTKTA